VGRGGAGALLSCSPPLGASHGTGGAASDPEGVACGQEGADIAHTHTHAHARACACACMSAKVHSHAARMVCTAARGFDMVPLILDEGGLWQPAAVGYSAQNKQGFGRFWFRVT